MKEMADPRLAGLLREYSESLRAQAPSPAVEASLLEALEQAPAPPVRSKRWGWIAAAAVAAAALFAFVTFRTPVAVRPVVEPKPAPVVAVAPPVVASPPVAAKPIPKPRPAFRNSPPAPREVVSEFVALAENEFLPMPRQAQVLRVSVPRATLTSLGFPVVGEDAVREDRVTADVLMDEDGVARAVRFVKTVY